MQNISAWRTAKKLAGITGRSNWHSLRHTAITRALMEHGVDRVHLSEYAGVSINTIQKVYLHSTAAHTAKIGTVLTISVPNKFEPSAKGAPNEKESQ
jgi:hypothetical protein